MQKKTIPEDQIPEVVAFIEAQARLERLKAAYPEVFEQLDAIIAEYNATLESAEKIVRAKKVSCGPFDMYQTQTTYNAEKLYEEVGRDTFLQIGGSIKTQTVYDVDKKKLEAHVTSGVLASEVVDVVRTVSPRYHKPEKIKV